MKKHERRNPMSPALKNSLMFAFKAALAVGITVGFLGTIIGQVPLTPLIQLPIAAGFAIASGMSFHRRDPMLGGLFAAGALLHTSFGFNIPPIY